MATAYAERERDTRGLDPDADTDVRDWALPDPHGAALETAQDVRDTVEQRVRALFDELEELIEARENDNEDDKT